MNLNHQFSVIKYIKLFFLLLFLTIAGNAQTVTKQLYLSDTGQILDRIDPVATSDATTAVSDTLGAIGGGAAGTFTTPTDISLQLGGEDALTPDVAVYESGGVETLHMVFLGKDAANLIEDKLNIYYAFKTGAGSWSAPLLISSDAFNQNTGLYPSIAVDDSNVAHIVYAHKDTDGLNLPDDGKINIYYNTVTSGVAGTPVRISDDTFGNDSFTPEIAIDANGDAHVAYVHKSGTDAKKNIYYVNNIGGTWSTPVSVSDDAFNQDVQNNPSIAIDSNGDAHIAYVHKDADGLNANDDAKINVYYANNTGGSWSTPEQVSDDTWNQDAQANPSIAIDGNDVPHIVYSHKDGVDSGDGIVDAKINIYYTEKTTGSWSTPVDLSNDVDGQDSLSPTIAVSDTGIVRVAFSNNGDNIYYTENSDTGGAWTSLVDINTAPTTSTDGTNPAIAITNNNVHVVYQDKHNTLSGKIDVWHTSAPLAYFGPTSTVFTQSPVLCSALSMPSGGAVSVTLHTVVTEGTMPASPDINVTLSSGSGGDFITLSNPTYTPGSGNEGTLTWAGTLSADVELSSSNAVTLTVTADVSTAYFNIEYDSSTKPSKVELPVTTYINIDSHTVYDAVYPGGNVVHNSLGSTDVYIRSTVSDPFGADDITGTDITITPSGSTVSAALVATNGCSKTYEYDWITPSSGDYNITATAKEGYEGTVTDTAEVNLSVCTNCPPNAVDDTEQIDQGDASFINVLDNDTDPNNNLDPTSVTITQNPSNGSVTYVGNGEVIYTPNGSYTGLDSFNYQVCDTTAPTPLCSEATVTLTIAENVVDVCAVSNKTHTYYLPFPEDTDYLYASLDGSGSQTPTSNTVRTIVSIKSPYPGIVIRYDHWEDGYEADLQNPVQTTTEIWGDGNIYNGIAPGYPDDILPSGASIIIDNNFIFNPRDPNDIFYDGKDKIFSSADIAVSKISGFDNRFTIQSGKTDVYDTTRFGTSFVIPFGEDIYTGTQGYEFQYTSLFIRAAEDGTEVIIDVNNDGVIDGNDVTATLNEGEVLFYEGTEPDPANRTGTPNVAQSNDIHAGATVTSTKPVGVDVLFGGIDSYGTRNINLLPGAFYGSSYYTPVPTMKSTDSPAAVYIYNGTGSSMDITVSNRDGLVTTLTIPTKTTQRYQLPFDTDTGYKFENLAGDSFTIMEVVDSEASGSTYDWGFGLIAADRLTDFTSIAWAPGSNDFTRNDDPLWVTPTADTTLYIKWDGAITFAPNTSPCGAKYDVAVNLSELESYQIRDTSDNDQSGTALFTCDGTTFAAVYGEDTSTALTASPSLDVGTTMQPMCKAQNIYAVDDFAVTPPETPVLIGVTDNDSGFFVNVDPASLSTDGLIAPSNGVISLNTDGTILYTPNAGFAGEDTFEYHVCSVEQPDLCTVATVTVLVTDCNANANNALIKGYVYLELAPDDGTYTDEATLAGRTVDLYSDSDGVTGVVDGADAIIQTLVTNAGGAYSFAVNTTGNYIVKVNTNDGQYAPATLNTVPVNITSLDTCSNDIYLGVKPVLTALDDSSSGGVDQSQAIDILDNDLGQTDPSTVQSSETNTSLLAPSNGTVTVNPDGTVSYIPNPGYIGTDTFEYRVCSLEDPNLCDVALVNVTISCASIPGTNIISGKTFYDVDLSASLSIGEDGVTGVNVNLFEDTNKNGVLDGLEGSTIIDTQTVSAYGDYNFSILAPTTTATYRDEFNVNGVIYGTDGTDSWATPGYLWTEIGEGDGLAGGKTKIDGNELIITGSKTTAVWGAYRKVNILNASSATLTYAYERSGLDDADDHVKVQITSLASPTAADWVTLETITGANGTGTSNWDISAYASTHTTIRFVSSGIATFEDGEKVIFDNVQISYGSVSSTYLDYFSLDDNASQTAGTVDWSTNAWVEIGEADGFGAGEIVITANDGLAITNDETTTSWGAYRTVPLDGAGLATLSYTWLTESLDDADDWVDIQVASSPSGPWTTLETIVGPSDGVSGNSSFSIPSSLLSATTTIRFVSSDSGNMKNSDIVFFDNIQVKYSSSNDYIVQLAQPIPANTELTTPLPDPTGIYAVSFAGSGQGVCSNNFGLAQADLVTVKTLASGNATPNVGDTVTFSIAVTNNGPTDAASVSLADTLPAGLTATGSSATLGTYTAPNWTIPLLPAGSTAILTLSGTVTAAAGTTITNTTTKAISLQPDPTDVGNDLTESVTVNLPPIAFDDSVTGITGTATTLTPVDDNGNGADSDPEGSLDASSLVLTSSTVPGAIIAGDGKSATIPNEGTWTVLANGDVTFTPLATFTGDPTPIGYKVSDNTGLQSNEAFITIDYPQTAPVAVNDSVSNPGLASPSNPTTLPTLSNDGDAQNDINASSVNITTAGATDTDNDGDLDTLIVAGQGTWTVDNITGNITFTPALGFTGDPTPISYNVKDNTGLTSNDATETVDYQQPPVAQDDDKLAQPAGPVTLDPTADNGYGLDSDPDGTLDPTTVSLVDPNNGTATGIVTDGNGDITSMTITGEGTWSVDIATGEITFTPETGFTADPTPQDYNIEDNDGNPSNNATITIDYVQTPPVAVNDSVSNPNPASPTNPTTLPTLDNDTDPENDINASSVSIEGGTDTDGDGDFDQLIVDGEGTWTVDNTTGNILFTPEAGFIGDPTAITYTVKDNTGLLSNTATQTVDYPQTPPVAVDDSATNPDPISDTNPTTLNVTDNDSDPENDLNVSTVDFNATSVGGTGTDTDGDGDIDQVVVPGEGTWTVNEDGNVTFTPLATFTANPTPINYTVSDSIDNTSNEATISLYYPQDTPTAIDDAVSNPDLASPSNPTTVPTLSNDLNGTLSNINASTVSISSRGLTTDTDGDGDLDQLIVPGEGTWTVDNTTGAITFTPEVDFTGDPTPITYYMQDNDGAYSNTATVTVDYPQALPVAVDDSASNPEPISATNPTTLNVIGNDSDPENDLNVSTVHFTDAAATDTGTDGYADQLIVANEGTWSVDVNGNVTFTPEAGFTGNPTPITYTVDNIIGGTSNEATISIYYPQINPTALDDSESGDLGQAVTLGTLDNDLGSSTSPLDLSSVSIVGGTDTDSDGDNDSLTVAGEGVWTVNNLTGNITFTPEAGFLGDPTPITYTVKDEAGNVSNTATQTVDYPQDPPVAENDSTTGLLGQAATVSTLQNDTDPQNNIDFSTVTIIISGATDSDGDGDNDTLVVAGEGTWTVNDTTGNITFTPEEGFTGDPTPIAYTVTDTTGLISNVATVNVYYPQITPRAIDDIASGIVGEPVTLPTLDNDLDLEGNFDPSTVSITTTGATSTDGSDYNDTLVVSGEGTWTVDTTTGNITFTPEPGFTGDPTPITYTVTDLTGYTSNEATQTVLYTQTVPTAVNDSATGTTGATTLSVTGNDSDPEGDLNVSTVDFTDPAATDTNGDGYADTLVVAGEGTWTTAANGEVTFTPLGGFTNDPTPINYTISDEAGNTSNIATISVYYPQTTPTAIDDTKSGITGDPVILTTLSNDLDANGDLDESSVDLVNTNIPGSIETDTDLDGDIDQIIVPGEGTWTVDDASGDITFTPEAGFTGNPTPITYTVKDDLGNLSNDATVTVLYTQPVAVDDSKTGTTTDGISDPTTLNVTTNDSDPEGDLDVSSVHFTHPDATDENGADGYADTLVVAGQGTWTVDVDGNVTFTPLSTFTGNPTPINYTISDLAGNTSNEATITINYTQAAPTAINDLAYGTIGDPVTLATLDNDLDSNISDINVSSVNLVNTNISGATETDTDGDGDIDEIVVPNQGTWSVNDITGNITFTPEAGFTGNPTPITYNVEDNAGTVSNDATQTVIYTQTVPVAVDDSATGITGSATTLNAVANDSDPEDDLDASTFVFTRSIATGAVISADGKTVTVPNEGTWTVDASGNVTFTPLATFTGNPTPVNYRVSDATGTASNEATISVYYPQTAPTAVNDTESGTTGNPVTLTTLSNDLNGGSTIDASTVNITTPGATDAIGSDGYNDTLVVAGEGTWSVNTTTGDITFTPESGFTGDPTPITYNVEDTGGTVSNDATQTVDYPQTAPIAVDDAATGTAGTATTLSVTGNDSDPENDLNVSTVSFNPASVPGSTGTDTDGDGDIDEVVVPGEGTWTVASNGEVTFTPESGFTGNPTPINYTVSDTTGLTSNAATITIDYPQTAPIAVDDSKSGTIGEAVTLPTLDNDTSEQHDLNLSSVSITSAGAIDTDGDGDLDTLVVDGEGNWTVDNITGNITFTPDEGYEGNPTPITYTVEDTAGNTSNEATQTVTYEVGTLPITIAYVYPELYDESLQVDFSTATEVGNIGFNIYAIQGKEWIKLNEEMILGALDSFEERDYQVSLRMPDTLKVKKIGIAGVDVNGIEDRHGPFTIGHESGSKTTAVPIDWKKINRQVTTDRKARKAAKKEARKLAQTTQTGDILAASVGVTGFSEYDQVTYLEVEKDAVYRVTHDELLAAGINFTGKKASEIAVSFKGEGVARTIEGLDKKAKWTSESWIEFKGTKPSTSDALYLSANKYQLTLDNKRVVQSGSIAPVTAKEMVFESNIAYSNSTPSPDPFYDGFFYTIGTSIGTLNRTFDLPALGEGESEITVHVASLSNVAHQLEVMINGETVDTRHEEGRQAWEITVTVDNAILNAGSNTLTLRVTGQEEGFDIYTYDKLVVSYDDGQPVASSSAMITFREKIDAKSMNPKKGTNYVIISHPLFMNEILDHYVSQRASEGWKIAVVNVEDIYAAYGYGMETPEAIKAYLRTAKDIGVTHVQLIGAANYDYHDYLGLGSVSFIPSIYVETGRIVSYTPSDTLYVADETDMPQMAIGRWPVRTLEGLEAVVNKTLTWESSGQSAAHTALFIADRYDGDLDYAQQMEQLTITEKWSDIDRVYMDDFITSNSGNIGAAVTAARESIMTSLEEGASITSFSGHSSPQTWSYDGLLTQSDVASVQNEGKPTLALPLACYTTYADSPTVNTMAHQLVAAGENGAVAVYGAALFSSYVRNGVIAEKVIEHLLAGETIGQAVLKSKNTLSEAYHDTILNGSLLGDVTLRLK